MKPQQQTPPTSTEYVEPLGFKGTKGEWYLNDLNKGYLSIDVDEPDGEEFHSAAIAEIKPTTNEDWEYDAKLIAESKNLAKALQEVINVAEMLKKTPHSIPAIDDAKQVLKQAGLTE